MKINPWHKGLLVILVIGVALAFGPAPASATHFRIVMAANEYDFANRTYSGDTQQTAILALDTSTTSPISQVLTITAGTVLPVAAVVGVIFYELVNGDYWEMSNHSFNTLAVTLADKV